MGDPDEPTVRDRPASGAPTVDIAHRGTKITEPSTAASAFDPPDDRFEQRGELGRGGMGRVDEAFDRALGRDVAIKHMLSHSDVDLARFEREARITARLEHPGIVPIHDAGRSADGTPYYVMRRVDGQPLSELVEGKPLADRLRLVPNILAACDAAGFAHARGIVHRDIKPTNILIGPFGETLLIDWGLAREMESRELATALQPPSDPSLTRAGTVAGTPGFMSPEQARGESVDARADVFALGATLFYVLAGTLPWHGGSTEMIDHVGAGRPADWRLMPREVPPDLRAIVEKAMAPSLADRYPDATALAADLRRFTLGNLVAAYEYGLIARLVRFLRRHRAAVLVGTVSVVILAVVAVISVHRVIAERDEANSARQLAESRQREATAAADRLLVEHARELSESDPIAAIATLRTLSPESTRWLEAWSAAFTAWLRGIPFGFHGDGRPTLVGISADDRYGYAISIDTGRITLIELATRTKRDLPELGRTYAATWLDPSHIIQVLDADVAIVDVTTGQVRRIGLAQAVVWSDRISRAHLRLPDGRLLELVGADGEPHEIASGVDDYAVSHDLSEAVITRGRHREIRSGGHSYLLPDLTDETAHFRPTYTIGAHMVASIELQTVRIWEVRDGKLVDRGTWPQPHPVIATGIARGEVFAVTVDEVVRITDRISRAIHGNFTSVTETRRGFAIARGDGGILLRDDAGVFELGARPARYQRIDVSLDGRFVIAHTTSGDVLVWNVGALRPPSLPVGAGGVPVQLTAKALWVFEAGEGMRRYSLATGESQLAVEEAPLLATYMVPPDERWIAILDGQTRTLFMTDRDRANPVTIGGIVLYAYDGVGVTYVRTGGTVWRWRPNEPPREAATIGGEVMVMAATGQHAVVAVGDHDVTRIHFATGTRERCEPPGVVSKLNIAPDGTVWIISDAGAYRWLPSAASPEALAMPEPVDDLELLPGGAIFHAPRSLIVVKQGAPRVYSVTSRGFAAIHDDLVALVDPQGGVGVLDLVTGLIVNLPASQLNTLPLVVSDGQIGVAYLQWPQGGWMFGSWKLSVPRKPAELQQWLRDVTNAKPVPGSEAVAWP